MREWIGLFEDFAIIPAHGMWSRNLSCLRGPSAINILLSIGIGSVEIFWIDGVGRGAWIARRWRERRKVLAESRAICSAMLCIMKSPGSPLSCECLD